MAQAKNNSSLDLTDAVSQSEAFILKNRKLLIAGIVAIIVIVGGAFAAKYLYFDPRSEKADTMLPVRWSEIISLFSVLPNGSSTG